TTLFNVVSRLYEPSEGSVRFADIDLLSLPSHRIAPLGIARTFQNFVSPESFSLTESVMIVAMVVLGGLGHLPGVILGAVLLSSLPEVLRWVSGVWDLQRLTDGRLDASILRQLLIALAMIIVMLMRPRGLWPTPEHGKTLPGNGK
ncbi:MAG: hypothetical protein ACJ8GO_03510, partial [Ramlibacter sp.]